MKIIHSANTKPMLMQRWKIKNLIEKNLWLYGYSLDYANRIGLDIELHTDTYGASIFDCLPYKAIHTTLDELDVMEVPDRFWSAGKILALKYSDLGTLHIDGDVFLKQSDIIPLLEMSGATSATTFDAICQMQERQSIFMESYENLLPMFNDALSGTPIDGYNTGLTQSLNAGILGFNNRELKNNFIQGYFEILSACTASQDFMSLLKYDLNKYIEPNIVVEQYYLAGLVDKYKYKMKYLLEVTSDDFQNDVSDVNFQANEIGFCHAWGASKYLLIEQIKDILLERNPDLHKAISQKVIDIYNI